jgi:hypothetical protein
MQGWIRLDRNAPRGMTRARSLFQGDTSGSQTPLKPQEIERLQRMFAEIIEASGVHEGRPGLAPAGSSEHA